MSDARHSAPRFTLFDVARRRRHGGTKALVHLPLDACPTCGGGIDREANEQSALLRHGGHGATLVSVRLHCRCGWTLLQETTERRP